MQITPHEIAETLSMVSEEHLDIRTITLGLNLRGCADVSADTVARKVYNRMVSAAKQLVPVAEQLEREYGIPIVNKRISVTPIAEICSAVREDDLTPIAEAMDRAGKEVGVDFVGGFTALVHKGASRADIKLMESIPHALSVTDRVCSSVNVGSTRAGINMDAVRMMGETVKAAAARTASRSVTSSGTGSAVPPSSRISRATSSSTSGRRPDSAIGRPSSAAARAAARPMPDPAPVIHRVRVSIAVVSF